MLTWVAFGAAFASRPKAPRPQVRKKEPAAMVGMAVQGVAYAIVWSGGSVRAAPLPAPVRRLGVAIAAGGVLIAWSAARHLGKQWALQARLVEGHELVTTGPYAFVRHPIYSAMLAMLVGTGLVVARLSHLAVALPVFLAGTLLRTRMEERLLRDAFGEGFEAYRRRAGWLFPRWRL